VNQEIDTIDSQRNIMQYPPDRNNNSHASTEMSKKINEAYANFNLIVK
jgi:hypothetical protein